MPIEGVQTTSKKLCHHPSRAVPPPKTAFFVQECGIFMSGGVEKRGSKRAGTLGEEGDGERAPEARGEGWKGRLSDRVSESCRAIVRPKIEKRLGNRWAKESGENNGAQGDGASRCSATAKRVRRRCLWLPGPCTRLRWRVD